MRLPFVAGNWKMNKTVAQSRTLVSELRPVLDQFTGVEIVLCPPSTTILSVAALLEGTDIGIGAQNMHWEERGAFTGEIAPEMVAEFCNYVIIAHSERRAHFNETDATVNKKALASQKHELTPIVCVGETLEEKEAGCTAEVVRRQVMRGLAGLDPIFATHIVVAYEPIWAIGTGRASSGEAANEVVRDVIRPALADLFDEIIAGSIRVLYGGSVVPDNANEFFGQSDIDGALVGGASLKLKDFTRIVEAAVK